MTREDFRKLALALPQAEEKSHMGHPDFRVKGRIFATLPDVDEELSDVGMVKLTLEQQAEFVEKEPGVFGPCQGAWGLGGATYVRLGKAKVATVRLAVGLAWENVSATGTKKKVSPRGAGSAGKRGKTGKKRSR
jgi:hypothetical protein